MRFKTFQDRSCRIIPPNDLGAGVAHERDRRGETEAWSKRIGDIQIDKVGIIFDLASFLLPIHIFMIACEVPA
jgi:hypothetical protein